MNYGVIFDLDGVLIDSSQFHRESWRVVGYEFGFEMTDELFWRTFGMPNRRIIPLLLGRQPDDSELHTISERKEEVFRELARGHLQPLPGAVELVKSVAVAGFRIALGSSTPRSNIEVALDTLDIRPYFHHIVCSDDVSHGKPHPEVFLKAAAGLGLAPQRCVVIEDAVVGVQAARAAGARCVAVATTHAADKLKDADRVVADLREVTPEYLANLIDAAP